MPDSLELPPRLDLPLFAYGLLQPDQPAYGGVVAALVADANRARLPVGGLRYRDGLPILDPDGAAGVEGSLLRFAPGQEKAAYDAVCGFEPRHHYRWHITEARLGVDGRGDGADDGGGGSVRVNVLQGRHPERGVADEWFSSWSADADPLLRYGLHAVRRAALEHGVAPFPSLPGDSPALWERFYGLQSAYLLLWSAVERYAAIACSPSEEPLARVYRLGDDQSFKESVVAAGVAPLAKTADARDPGRSRRIREDGSGAMYAWESVRATLGHPGRTAFVEGTVLRRSLVELHDTLRLLLLTRLPGVADTWRELDPEGSVHRWLLRPVVSSDGLSQ
ncbi:MAG: hypothetical protein QOG82_870 [Actinomycetota bacterium]|jgi:hypothetical protein|nr:hypothetical protein [Actinomycetota bacterium]